MKITVLHAYYGCDTGCCGHTIEIEATEPGEKLPDRKGRRFDFSHPYGEDHLEFAKEMVRDAFGEEHVKDLDWENCEVSED